jgi:PPOX class probable F420-dependent enzyme
MRTTSIPDSHRDLLRTQVAVFATMDRDGYPQLTAVWFLAEDDGTIRISLNTKRRKVKNLERNPKCTLFILDPANPTRYLEIRADAEITDDDDYAFADRISAKYGANLRTMDAAGNRRVVVTLRPVRVNAVDMSAG